MFRNYLTLAFRNLSRQKAFSIINISGLAIGLASSLTILLWVRDELDYDRFHMKADRTYRLIGYVSDIKAAITPAPVVPTLQETFPEIEHNTRLWPLKSVMFQNGDKRFEEKSGYYAEPSFFEIFDFKLEQGDKKTALIQPNGAVISKEVAIKYFGTTDALGKILKKDNADDFIVTGILAEPAGNSHLRFDILLPWAYLPSRNRDIRENNWGNFDFYCYITFRQNPDGATLKEFEGKIDKVYAGKAVIAARFLLQPLNDIHLRSNFMADVAGHGNFRHVAVFALIAVFIVLIGCINFMNLSTARSARRAKEVGLRKVAGAFRAQLVRQFLGESFLVSMISLTIAMIITALSLPTINEITGKSLFIDFTDPMIVGAVLAVTVITGILSGLYPAFILSGFTPIKVLKKEIKGGAGGIVFRNVLVVSQFVISIFLLVGTTVVYKQLQYIRSKDLGYDKENLLTVSIHGDVSPVLNKWQAAFRSDLATANATIASALPTDLVSGTAYVKWQGKPPDKQIVFATLFIDDNFVPVYGMEMASGRNFNKEMRGDSSSFLINQKAAEVMGFTDESAIGQPVDLWGMKGNVIGVIKDFNFKPLSSAVEPMLLRANQWGGTVVIKAEAGRTEETIAAMQRVWSSLETLYPFSYSFVDQDLENLYKGERQIGTLFSVFAALAIFISCLGLYGLSIYIAEQRTREIGIRKALGASVGSIVYLLNTRFATPVLIAMILASPLAWFAMNKWLEGFAYRVDFSWIVVVIAGMAALLVSLLTVSYETVKAATVNPVKSLRQE
ncbi:MAG TPA: ABC transporter permease [Cyclobacteriaceae bacterium]|nr:ABC transporter permease [Cyclobacteriaceae bacterium]